MSEQDATGAREDADLSGNNLIKLTPQQSEIVRSVAANQLTMVGAGAGAGKTFTTVQTVLDRLEQTATQIDQFILITFTRAAAHELHMRMEKAIRERVDQPLQGGKPSSFWREQLERLASAYVGTIHGFCSKVLSTFGYAEGIAREAAPYFATYLRTQALRDSVDAHINREPPDLLEAQFDWDPHELERFVGRVHSQARGLGIRIDDLASQTAMQVDDAGKRYRLALIEMLQNVEAGYVARKRERQLLDGDDLIARTADLLTSEEGQQIVKKLVTRYRYLFVDEFQDTDPAQGRIISALLADLDGVLLVGDGKQSIYGFRGAVSLMEVMAEKYAVRILPLNQSRRPTRLLLNIQNELFSAIGQYPRFRFLADPLYASDGTIEPQSGIVPLQYERAADGVAAVADAIRQLIGQPFDDPDRLTSGMRPIESGDIVLLARTNTILKKYRNGLEAALRPDGIAVRIEDRGQFYQRPEIVATLRMLQLLLRFPEDTLLSMVLGGPYLPGINASAEEKRWLRYGPASEGNPISEWFTEVYPEQSICLNELRRMARVDTVPQIIMRLYRDFGTREHYASIGDLQALANLDKLRELARRLFKDEQALTLSQFVSFLQLKVETEAEEEDAELPVDETEVSERLPYVRLMTVHGAKGREFPFVLIPEIERRLDWPEPNLILSSQNGLDMRLPARARPSVTESPFFAQSVQDEVQRLVEEEMRIFYVAVTRAQHAVLLFGNPPAPRRGTQPESWLQRVEMAWPSLSPDLVVRYTGQH